MNGTIKSMAEYTKDKTTWTGEAGSETNPWAIEDVYDFCAADILEEGSSLIYALLVNDIDFNNHKEYKNGLPDASVVNAPHVVLMGDNSKEIRNMVIVKDVRSSSLFAFDSYHDIIFSNIVITETNNSDLGVLSARQSFIHCTFGFKLMGGWIIDFFERYNNHTETFTDCCLCISGVTKKQSVLSYLSFDRCHIYFDNLILTQRGQTYSDDGFVLIKGGTVSNSYFDGSLQIQDSKGQYSYVLLSVGTTFQNSYFNFSLNTNNKGIRSYYNSSYRAYYNSYCFGNKDKISSSSYEGTTNFEWIDTSHCTSSAYLTSKGFMTGG